MRARIVLVMGALALWGALLGGNLFHLQIVQHEEMVSRAIRQREERMTIPPRRGEILDRNGRPLAVSILRDSFYAVPSEYRPEDIPGAGRTLGRCLGVSSARIARMLRRDSRFSWLKRRATPEQSECARQSGYPVAVIEEYGRAWPGGRLAAQLLGFTGSENNGLSGIESAWNEVLRGEPGVRLLATDGRRASHGSRIETPSRAGRDLQLTLDLPVQAIIEDELARGVEEIGASGGAIILVETRTGEILGMASAPSFLPERYQNYPAGYRVNRTVSSPYEPGSVFKLVSFAAALNEGVTHESERFDTGGGQYAIGRRAVHDWKPLGILTLEEVFARSSNIGTLQVAERLGSDVLGRYIERFGFGRRTGIGLGGESRGIVPRGGRWRPIRLATVSFGQGIAVTPVQMVQAANVLANGGLRAPLRLVRSVGGVPVPAEPAERVVTEATAARMRAMMERVVETGTGSAAAVPGFRIAGKTGTAQKAAPGGYSDTEYTSSFAGFAPAGDPRFTAVVILDAHKPRHSGTFAARVFGRIAVRVLWRQRLHGSDVERIARSRFRGHPEALVRVASDFPADASLRDRVAALLEGGDPVRTAAALPEGDDIESLSPVGPSIAVGGPAPGPHPEP